MLSGWLLYSLYIRGKADLLYYVFLLFIFFILFIQSLIYTRNVNPFSMGTDFRRQILTSKVMHDGRRPIA